MSRVGVLGGVEGNGRGAQKIRAITIIVPYFQLMKFETKAIAATFFEQVSSVENGNGNVTIKITKFRCHCGVERTQLEKRVPKSCLAYQRTS